MSISTKLGQTIIDTLRDVIPMDLNFFNRKGVIIASTNPVRQGDFHEGAKQAMEKGKMVVVEYDGQYQGARRGINVPLCFQDQIIGAIGITGERETVVPYGTIIKKMTEILIREDWIEKNRIRRRDSMKYWIENVITGNDRESTEPFWEGEKRLAVGRCAKGEFTSEEVEELYRILDSCRMDELCRYAVFFHEVVLLFCTRQEQLGQMDIRQLEEKVNAQRTVPLIFAVSESYSLLEQTQQQYEKLTELLQWSRERKLSSRVLYWEKMDVEKIFCALPKCRREEYVDRLWKTVSQKEKEEMSRLILSYAEHDGSLQEIAQELFLHKNTIQYRLNKIAEKTGYNPRKLKDFSILYFAVRMEKE